MKYTLLVALLVATLVPNNDEQGISLVQSGINISKYEPYD